MNVRVIFIFLILHFIGSFASDVSEGDSKTNDETSLVDRSDSSKGVKRSISKFLDGLFCKAIGKRCDKYESLKADQSSSSTSCTDKDSSSDGSSYVNSDTDSDVDSDLSTKSCESSTDSDTNLDASSDYSIIDGKVVTGKKRKNVDEEKRKREEEELKEADFIPELDLERFSLCSELNIDGADKLEDGEAATCVIVCLYRKMHEKIYDKKPQGFCKRKKYHLYTKTMKGFIEGDLKCVCENNFTNKYEMVQDRSMLYFVHTEHALTKISVRDLYDYVKDNLEDYFKEYTKVNKSIDWSGNIKYIATFKWLTDSDSDADNDDVQPWDKALGDYFEKMVPPMFKYGWRAYLLRIL